MTVGTFPLTVVLPLSDLQAGTLPTSVVASSITPTGVAAGYIGGAGEALTLRLGSDGRVQYAASSHIPGVSTYTAFTDADNNWAHAQTSQSSWSIKRDLLVTGVLTLTNALTGARRWLRTRWSTATARGLSACCQSWATADS